MDPVLAPVVPVQPASSGAVVANLHAVLARLNLAGNIPPAELAAQIRATGATRTWLDLCPGVGHGGLPGLGSRNPAFQRPRADALAMLSTITDIYLGKA